MTNVLLHDSFNDHICLFTESQYHSRPFFGKFTLVTNRNINR